MPIFNFLSVVLSLYLFHYCSSDLQEQVSAEEISETVSIPSACLQPVKVGSCRGKVPRYFYNNETENCEIFYYGGCGGNSNKFETFQHCISTCKSQLHYRNLNDACTGVKCPTGGISHYRELGCTPMYDDGACCPTRYDCPDRKIQKNSSQCVYNGKLYTIGEQIPEADSGPGCRASCSCSSSGINCAHVECADLFGYYPNDNCRIGLYKRGDCCAFDYGCGNETAICQFEGRQYIEGEKFYPRDEPCLSCYCKPGFNGSLTSEFCEVVDCGIQIWYSKQLEKGCTPVYYLDSKSRLGCCPVSWHCPEDAKSEVASNESLENESIPVLKNDTVRPGSDSILSRVAERTKTVSRADICRLPKDTGDCMAARSRYFYNNETKRCEEFTYTGCKGNLNNFLTFQDCLRTCAVENREDTSEDIKGRFATVSLQVTATIAASRDPCTQDVRPGLCRAYFARFYFNPAANRCQLFIYGGCGRNDNNFKNMASCEATCLTTYPTTICTKKPLDKIMHCGKENLEKYYFDANEGGCKKFISTGCSAEKFFTRMEECESVCNPGSPAAGVPSQGAGESICELPMKQGSCYANIPSYFYDSSSKSCKSFLYGGCFGNRNRFTSMESCRKACEEVISPPPLISVLSSRVNFGDDSPPKNNTTKRNVLLKILQENEDVIFSRSVRFTAPQRRSIQARSLENMMQESAIEGGQENTNSGTEGYLLLDATTSEGEAVTSSDLPMLAEDTATENDMDEISETTGSTNDDVTPSLEDTSTTRSTEGKDSTSGENISDAGPTQTDFSLKQSGMNPTKGQAQTAQSGRKPEGTSSRKCQEQLDVGGCSQAVLRFFWDGKECRPFNYTGCGGNDNRFSSEYECQKACSYNFEDTSKNLFCLFGNEFIPFGKSLQSNELCGSHFCTCSIPPSLTCTVSSCP